MALYIDRLIPDDEYEALLAANAPTQLNPYATIADLTGGDGNGIYDGSGSLSANTEVALGTFDINFALSDNFGRFSVGPVGFAAARNIHFKAFNNNAIRIEGADDLAASRAFDIVNDSGELIAEFYNDSDISLAPILGVTNRARVTIGATAVVANARLTVKGGSDSVGVPTAVFINNSNDVIFQIQNSGSMAMGTGSITADTRFTVRGFGNTNSTNTMRLESLSGADRVLIRDDGSTLMAAGGGVSGFAGFANVWRATSFTVGWGFYANNVTNAGLSIQMLGTTNRGIAIANQGNPTGTVKGGNTQIGSTAATINYGWEGTARNGSNISVGVRGVALGGATVASSAYVAGVEGFSQYNLDVEQRGGYFNAVYNNAALNYTEDIIGSVHIGSGTSTGGAGSTGKVVGLKASTNGTQGTGDRIAIWVPALNNNGNVVLNADDSTGNGYTLEITGGLELNGDGTGFRMYQPDGTAREITLNNAGAFVIT